METDEKGELIGALRDYVILTLLMRKGLIGEVDIQEQIEIVRAEVPKDHPLYGYLMEKFDRMERMLPSSSYPSPIMNDPMVPFE